MAEQQQAQNTLQLPGGKLWTRKTNGVDGYTSEDGRFDIFIRQGYVVLVAYDHAPIVAEDKHWRRRFGSIEQAMEHAEKM